MIYKLSNLFLLLLFLTLLITVRNDEVFKALNIKNITQIVTNFDDEMLIKDEYIVLPKINNDTLFADAMADLDLTVVQKIDDWFLLKEKDFINETKTIKIDSLEAKLDQTILEKLNNHELIFEAFPNHVEEIPSSYLLSCSDSEQVLDDIAANDTPKIISIMPNDPLVKSQWQLLPYPGMNVLDAWKQTVGSKLNVIAIVDRNFIPIEQDSNTNFCSSRNYYYKDISTFFNKNLKPEEKITYHGTQVLSSFATCTNNSVGLSGIDWHAQIFLVDSKEDNSITTRLAGLLWAAGVDICSNKDLCKNINKNVSKNFHPANIINASFGFAGKSIKNPPYGITLDVIGKINKNKGIIVASAGNEGAMSDRRLPGSAGGVISVSSSNKKGQSANFSNYGKTIDALAPGENILGSINNELFYLNGTSFSAPGVSAVISLMLSQDPYLTWKEAEIILKETAKPISCDDYCPENMKLATRQECKNYCCSGSKVICASGIVDASLAVSMAKKGIKDRPIIDLDDYYFPLSEANDFTHTVVIKNYGFKDALISLTSDNKILMQQEKIYLPAAKDKNNPSYISVLIKDTDTKNARMQYLAFNAHDIKDTNKIIDKIEAIAAVKPNNNKMPLKLQDLP